MENYFKVSIVMGTKNEEKAIGKVIKDIKIVTKDQAEIIIVDGSIDRTPIIAEELGAKVFRQEPKGYGIAIKLGLLLATRDIIITTDCDDTYPVEDIPRFVQKIEEGYDIVSGSRFGFNKIENMTKLNRFGNKLFAKITSILYGINVTDITTGMRAYRREVVKNIIWTENIGLSAELLFKPALMKYKIIEIPIIYKERIGETKLNPIIGGISILKSILKYALLGIKIG
jgi:glycosyltransferase involved in cell wall biosynthesis